MPRTPSRGFACLGSDVSIRPRCFAFPVWPWGHLAFGYVCYSIGFRLRRGRTPDGRGALAAALGTQFPDLVDKPLAWTFHVLPSGRSLTGFARSHFRGAKRLASLAHSLLVATVVLAAVHAYRRRQGDSVTGTAFAVGYLSHLAGDAFGPLLAGEYVFLSFLGWPLLAPPPYGDEGGFGSHVAAIELTPLFLAQLGFALAIVGLWVFDGTPGLAEVRALVRRVRSTSDRDR